jgi:hypothetical protein
MYSLGHSCPDPLDRATTAETARLTLRDQQISIFARMSLAEMEAMFDRDQDGVTVKRRIREGVTWHIGDAGDRSLVDAVGLHEFVFANRFLCHMQPQDAEACLRNVGRLVKPGGYLFVSGVDLGVRTKVARDLGWSPVTQLIREIHDGDSSLRKDWPMQYWGLEPFDPTRGDWKVRYASVFQVPSLRE